jgi:hypothetical protein
LKHFSWLLPFLFEDVQNGSPIPVRQGLKYINFSPNFPSEKIACHPEFCVLAEDLGKFLSKLHKARCQMDGVTGLDQLGVPLMPLETIASTQKVLADEASPRNPPRSSLRHSHLQISEIACAIADLSLRCLLAFRPGGATEKLGVGKEKIGVRAHRDVRLVEECSPTKM